MTGELEKLDARTDATMRIRKRQANITCMLNVLAGGDTQDHLDVYLCKRHGILPGDHEWSVECVDLIPWSLDELKGLPHRPDLLAELEQSFAELEQLLRADLRLSKAAHAEPTRSIAPEDRTAPMTYRRAAKLMGKGDSKDAAEWLSKSVRDGSIACEQFGSRQSHVFSKHDFPKSVWPMILPNSP